MPSLDVIHARLFLLRATEPPAPATYAYTAVHGAVDTVARIQNGTAPAAVLGEVIRPHARIDDELRILDSNTARLLIPEDEDWPFGRLTSLRGHGVPLALWIRGTGSLNDLTSLAVTITGACASSEHGNAIAADISSELARAGVCIVSGGGLGIDAAALGGALAAKGRTIVVLPCGVDRTHPHQHAALYEAVTERGGLLVSEYPAGTPPTRVRFHTRCRLLAALTSATVIVEAVRRSGVLAAARAASDLGRRIYGVPGPVDAATSTGVNDLLRRGLAVPIGRVDDIKYREKLR